MRTSISIMIRSLVIAYCLMLVSCASPDHFVWRLYESGSLQITQHGASIPVGARAFGALAPRKANLSDDGRRVVARGDLNFDEAGLIVGFEIGNPMDFVDKATGITLRIWALSDSPADSPVVRRAPVLNGRALWPRVPVRPGKYRWSAELTLNAHPAPSKHVWPKSGLLCADLRDPGLSDLQALMDTRPSLLMTPGAEAIFELPSEAVYRFEVGVAHPAANDPGGEVTIQLRSSNGEREIARLKAVSYSWADTVLKIQAEDGDCRLAFACSKGAVMLGAPILTRESTSGFKGKSRPNILLISLDTVRADHLSPWGTRGLSSELAAFARRGVVFERVVCQSPITDASHHSIFTGLHVLRHGGGKLRAPSPEIPTLASVLSNAGYRTAAFTDNSLVSAVFGFSRGFERYWEHSRSVNDKFHLDEILDRCKNWLDNQRPGNPWFAFVHTYQAHSPYVNRKDPEMRSITIHKQLHPVSLGAVTKQIETDEYREGIDPRKLVEMAQDAYATEIAYLDERMALFLQNLDSEGFLDGTIVVICSDHGEAFFEHGFMEHANSLYEEATRVPLLIRFPGDAYAGTRVTGMVETIDIMPTLLEYANIQIPIDIDGVSLLNACRTNTPVRKPALSTHDSCFSVTIWPNKLIIPRGGRDLQLFHLDDDPEEVRNTIDDAEASLLDSLVSPLLEMLERAHNGYLLDIERPLGPMPMLTLSRASTKTVSALLLIDDDRLERGEKALRIRLIPSPLGRAVILWPPGELPSVTVGRDEPVVLEEDLTELGAVTIRVRRCDGRPLGDRAGKREELPQDLSSKLKALGYMR